MIAQKCGPSFCRLRAPRCFPHPAQDGSLRNIEAKHDQLAVDAWSTPGWVLGNHAEDEFAQFRADSLTTWANAMPREPSPIRSESGSVPANDRLRLDENQRLLQPQPEPPQHYPEQPVESSKSRLWMSLFQDRKLLLKRQVSKSKSRRERKSCVARIDRSLSKCSMRSVYRASAQVGPTSHLTDLKIDRYFGNAQLYPLISDFYLDAAT